MAQLRELIVNGPSRFLGPVIFNGDITLNGHLLPSNSDSKNLGSDSLHWNKLWIKTISADEMTIGSGANVNKDGQAVAAININGGIYVSKTSYFADKIYNGSNAYYIDGDSTSNLYSLTLDSNLTVKGKSSLGTVISGTWNGTVVGAAYGGTGKTTLKDSANALINALTTGSSTPGDEDYLISQYVGGKEQTYHRRPMHLFWSYIATKANSTYGGNKAGWGINITGNAASANTVTELRLRNYSGNEGFDNANDATEQGFHYMTAVGTNRPPFVQNVTNKDYRILTTAFSNIWLQQIATDFRCNEIYYRRKENGEWKNWVEIPTADNFVTANALTHCPWENVTKDSRKIVTNSLLAYWNGAYNASGKSNLAHCNQGPFGTIVTKNAGDYSVAGHNHDAIYVNVTGDTMTGNLLIKGDNPYIGFQNLAGTTKGYIQYIASNDTYAFGAGVVKSLVITNSGSISIPSGQTVTPRENNTGSIGTSTYKWDSIYTNNLNLAAKIKLTYVDLTESLDFIFT